MVEDIKGILRNISNGQIIHTNRECNSVAHFLAKFSFNVNEERIWIEEDLEGLQYYVQKDKNVIVKEE